MWAVLLLGFVGSVLGVENAYSSLNSMEALVHKEARVIDVLENLIAAETERLTQLTRYLSYYEESHHKAALDPAAFVRNPLNSFHLMNRLTTDWQHIEGIMETPVSNMSEIRQQLDLPVMGDLGGAAEALSRLQDTYKLNCSDLVKGVIRGVKYSQPMSAHDAWLLGKQFYAHRDYYHAYMWFRAALELNEAEIGTNPLKPSNRSAILDFASFSVYMLGNVRKALELTETFLELMPNCTRNMRNRDFFSREVANQKNETPDDIEMHRSKNSFWNQEVQEKYEKLCRGEVEVNHALKCRYTDNGNPYLLLGRVKLEEVNLDPMIVVFHDVIYDSEIEQIKEIARPVIARSTVTNFTGSSENKTQWVEKSRVSKTAFLNRTHKAVTAVDRRAGLLANLCETSSEQLQVLNYGIGGHYEPHVDFSKNKNPDRGFKYFIGNRIATLLYYMTDVEQGGATVFPKLGAAVFPRKGSAVLWYNLHRDGEGDDRTLHGACPVLIGDKWACNKWFHEGMQEFIRPCLLEQDSLRFAEDKDTTSPKDQMEDSQVVTGGIEDKSTTYTTEDTRGNT